MPDGPALRWVGTSCGHLSANLSATTRLQPGTRRSSLGNRLVGRFESP